MATEKLWEKQNLSVAGSTSRTEEDEMREEDWIEEEDGTEEEDGMEEEDWTREGLALGRSKAWEIGIDVRKEKEETVHFETRMGEGW